jgi:hypothetical protein
LSDDPQSVFQEGDDDEKASEGWYVWTDWLYTRSVTAVSVIQSKGETLVHTRLRVSLDKVLDLAAERSSLSDDIVDSWVTGHTDSLHSRACGRAATSADWIRLV